MGHISWPVARLLARRPGSSIGNPANGDPAAGPCAV